MTMRVTSPSWVPEGLEHYHNNYPLGLEYHDPTDTEHGYALVRVKKFCAECRKTFEGWEFQNQLENVQAVPDPEDPDIEIVVGRCDNCIDAWEAGRERRKLEVSIERLEHQLGRVTQKKAALRTGHDLLGELQRVRNLLTPGTPRYTQTNNKIEELEKTLNALSVMKGAA